MQPRTALDTLSWYNMFELKYSTGICKLKALMANASVLVKTGTESKITQMGDAILESSNFTSQFQQIDWLCCMCTILYTTPDTEKL